MARLDIDFVLIDESVVDYGYRCLMSGAQLEEFKANPLMLIMHLRSTEYYADRPSNEILLPIGKWVDIRIEDGKLLAKPEFDDDDPLAVKIEGKVKKGYLNAASVYLDPIAVSEDEDLMIKGQTGPTLTQWGIKETSIVDIPGCRNAMAIRDKNGKLLKLSSADKSNQSAVMEYLQTFLPTKNSSDMEKKLLATRLGLNENAAENEISDKLASVLTDAGNSTKLATENKTLKDQLVALKAAQEEQKYITLVDGAISAKKLAAGQREQYLKLAAADYETTKSLIDSMKSYKSIESTIGDDGVDNQLEISELMKLSGRDLYMSGKLERLHKLSLEHFKIKYKEAFDVDFKA